MQRIQTFILLITFFLLAACGQSEKPLTVAGYLHDIDAAQRVLSKYYANPADESLRVAANVAQQAMAKAGNSLRKCFGKEGLKTSAVDHACLDANGMKL